MILRTLTCARNYATIADRKRKNSEEQGKGNNALKNKKAEQGIMICTPKVRHFWRCIFFMARRKKFNTKYSPEFKLSVILDMREHGLGYGELVRKYWGVDTYKESDNHRSQVRLWERIYLEEGAAGLMTERRGRKSTSRPRKKLLDREIKNDLIAENQRLKERLEYLEMENEYLKKLDALVRAEEQQNSKKRK